jgi:hypothetical protein
MRPLGSSCRTALAACFALVAVATAQPPGEPAAPPKPAAGDPRPVVVLKAGETRTVQWCWGHVNNRGGPWFVTADGVLPKDWKDKPSQLTFEQDGVRFEVDVKASHKLAKELIETGPYTAKEKTSGVTLVAAVVHVSASPKASPGGRVAVVQYFMGTGFNVRLAAELRVVVTPKD